MAPHESATEPVQARCRAGHFTGVRTAGVDRFLGIRYAEPPTGALRFAAPAPLPATSDPIDATGYGGRCHQGGVGVETIFPDLEVQGAPGEDCLFLNIFAPAEPDDGGSAAVMVWFHGGAFINGSANEYDPTQIVHDQGVVVVTVSYRLGIFGFLDLSRLGDGFAGSANRGIQDQIAALGWVRDHIAEFGGDPGNVTIWGESAGGASVLALLGAPGAQGLFHRAMAFSGAETLTPPMDQLSTVFEHLGANSDADGLARLMAMPSTELAQLQWTAGFYAGTSLDGVVITRPSCEAIIDGGAADVPIIAGTTQHEGTFLTPHYAVDDQLLAAMLFGLTTSVGRDDGAAYREWLDREIGLADPTACMERAWFDLFRASALRVAAAASQHGAGGWVYDFEVETDHPLGVTHFADVPFAFNWIKTGGAREFTHPSTEQNRRVAEQWSGTVAEFAKTGLPGGHGLPPWPQYESDDPHTMRVAHRSEIAENPDGGMLGLYRVPIG